jgi:SPOR domain
MDEQINDDPMPHRRHRYLTVIVALSALMAFGGIVWYAYSNRPKDMARQSVPIVRADVSPPKTRPGEPGGVQVPHQDKTIYEQIDRGGRSATASPERLLPPPETPRPRVTAPETAPAPKAAEVPVAPANTRVAESTTRTQSPAPSAPPSAPGSPSTLGTPPLAPSLPAPAVTGQSGAAGPAATTATARPGNGQPRALTATPEPKAAEAPSAAPSATASATPSPAATPAPRAAPAPIMVLPQNSPAIAQVSRQSTVGEQIAVLPPGPKIQIASLGSQEEAQREWLRLSRAHADLFGALSHRIERVEIANKGTFFRIQVGSFGSLDGARAACAELQKRKQACMVLPENR